MKQTSASAPSTHGQPLPYCLQNGGGTIGHKLRSLNWANTPLGPLNHWPRTLQETAGLVLHAAFPMFLWWGRDLTIIHNDACAPAFGKRQDKALGQSARKLCSTVWPDVKPLVEKVLDEGEAVYCKNLPLTTDRNGYTEHVFATLAFSPVFNPDTGRVEGILCTFTETTDEVLQRQELTALNSAKDEFISLASHQLRTPATGVKQYLGMLLGGFVGELTQEQQKLAQHAYDSNERQLKVVSDLLSTAQTDSGKFDLHKEPVDLTDLIDDVLDEQASKFKERDQHVVFSHPEGSCMVAVDEDRIRMVLDNLVDNASKYTQSNSGKEISLSLECTDQEVIIRIQDQGVGISKDNTDAIFERFTRVNNPLSKVVGGTGLGLYLARKIVELHGGSLGVTSTIGKGSTFTVVLPT